jgi:serine-type D-Ala-D-Ala carboxypeptidase/endopeptidase
MYSAAASPDSAALPAIVTDDYVGDYPLKPNFVITVFSTMEGLRAQATGQPSFALRRVERDQFGLEGVPARVTFQRDEIGAVVGLTLNQAGRTTPAARHELDSQQKPVAGIALSDEQLAGIEGVYELAPTFSITIGRDRQLLTARATGQGAAPIYAVAADEFFYQVVDAQISFKRDEAGVVTGLVLHQNGQNIPGRKR